MGARACKRLGYEQLSASLALQGASHVYFPSPPRSCRAPSILAFHYCCWPWSGRPLSDGRLRWRGRETGQRMGAGRLEWLGQQLGRRQSGRRSASQELSEFEFGRTSAA